MDIVLAAEPPTIADLLSHHLHCPVDAQDISVRPNPEETGSFLVRWQLNRYLLSPDGQLALRAIRAECESSRQRRRRRGTRVAGVSVARSRGNTGCARPR